MRRESHRGRGPSVAWVAMLFVHGCGRVGYDQIPPPSSTGGTATGQHDAGDDASSSAGGVSSGGGAFGAAGSGGAARVPDASTGSGGVLTDSGCGALGCAPWWDSTFTRRRELAFDQTSQATVNGLSVLVRLNATRIGYGATRSGGEDLRFVDDNGVTVLPHEVERWDALGTSIVWVRVPQIDGGTALDHVWMYYGNATAPDAQQRSAVWSDYHAVYHLDSLEDSAGKQPQAVDHGTTVATDGIGHARELDGIASYLDLGSNLPLLENAGAMTLSLRVRVNTVVGERALLSFSVNSAAPTGLSRAFVSFVNAADVRAGGRAHDVDATSTFLTTTAGPMSVGKATWQHVAAVVDLATQDILIFVDGSATVTDALSTPFTAAATDGTPTSFNTLGASDDGSSQYLDGSLDEVRIAPARRSAAWVETDARSEADTLIRFGAEEVR